MTPASRGAAIYGQAPSYDLQRSATTTGTRSIDPCELLRRLERRSVVVVDLAPGPVYRRGHITGAWSGSAEHLRAIVQAFPAAMPIVLTSADGVIATTVAHELALLAGVPVDVLAGGTAAWTSCGLPLVTHPALFVGAPLDAPPTAL